jgi:shikimate dehydrogenase
MTRVFGVIGHPIAHSLSPVLHTAAFRALRLDALSGAFDVPERFLAPMLRGLVLSGLEGLNVTVPLKERVIPLLDRVDPAARAIGAVNTVVIRGRRTIGYNTDATGLTQALRELGWPARGRGKRPGRNRVLLLGAGGAARAAAWILARPGNELIIANRHPARARQLVRWLRRHRPQAHAAVVPWRQASAAGMGLVIQATTLGMRASDPLPLDVRTLRRGTLVYDLVYHRPTPLVQAARRRGCVAANGRSMLLYQGAESLRLWLGRTPPLGAMRRALNAQGS